VKKNIEYVIDTSFLTEAFENAEDLRHASVFTAGVALYAPKLIYWEMCNVILVKEKKGTVKSGHIAFIWSFLSTVRMHESDFLEIYDLAKRTGLTFYDAFSLQTAIDLRLPLAT
jgi:predicted nucleic acid-binding protein